MCGIRGLCEIGAKGWENRNSLSIDIVGEPEIQKLEKSGRKVAEF